MNIALRTLAFLACLSWVSLLTTGCAPKVTEDSHEADKHDDGHDHSKLKGKFLEGMVIVLDKEKDAYHLEYFRDEDDETVTVIVVGDHDNLDKAIPIEAEELVFVLKKPEEKTIKLKAKARKDDPKGKSSQFEAGDKIFAQEEDFEGQITVPINGTEYHADVKDHHDHDEDEKE